MNANMNEGTDAKIINCLQSMFTRDGSSKYTNVAPKICPKLYAASPTDAIQGRFVDGAISAPNVVQPKEQNQIDNNNNVGNKHKN
tara:strand:+ start:182 stop:436 length:255 start_codon:yes stop_codon:yes gene_type:complete